MNHCFINTSLVLIQDFIIEQCKVKAWGGKIVSRYFSGKYIHRNRDTLPICITVSNGNFTLGRSNYYFKNYIAYKNKHYSKHRVTDSVSIYTPLTLF